MALKREVTAADRRVVVRELTVAEVRQWLADNTAAKDDSAEVDVVGEFLLEALSLAELARFCDLTVAQMDACTDSEVQALARAAKELNPGFFHLRQRLWAALPAPASPTG